MSTNFSRLKAPILASILSTTLGLSVQPALAHATFENANAEQNSTHKATLRVPHGCEGQATLSVRITIPEGIIAVKPMPKAGWTLATAKGPLGRSYKLHGRDVNEGVKEIVWSGGSLPDDQYDEFTFQARITDALPAGQTVFLPVVQECASGKAAWIEIPAKGQDAHALKMPAPGIRITAKAQAASGHDHGAHEAAPKAGEAIKAGSLLITPPWSRATPGGAKVAGGYMKITNTGSETDRLVGGSAEIAKIFEVHEMKMEGNVMKMRALEKGLEIKPGETVELKPGGYHVMFIDIRSPFKEGERFKGHLMFEKAGKVEVNFKIEGRASTVGHDAHHGHGTKAP